MSAICKCGHTLADHRWTGYKHGTLVTAIGRCGACTCSIYDPKEEEMQTGKKRGRPRKNPEEPKSSKKRLSAHAITQIAKLKDTAPAVSVEISEELAKKVKAIAKMADIAEEDFVRVALENEIRRGKA